MLFSVTTGSQQIFARYFKQDMCFGFRHILRTKRKSFLAPRKDEQHYPIFGLLSGGYGINCENLNCLLLLSSLSQPTQVAFFTFLQCFLIFFQLLFICNIILLVVS